MSVGEHTRTPVESSGAQVDSIPRTTSLVAATYEH